MNKSNLQLAEQVRLIGPASRTHDLHSAIERFANLVRFEERAKAKADAKRYRFFREYAPTLVFIRDEGHCRLIDFRVDAKMPFNPVEIDAAIDGAMNGDKA